VQRQQLNYALLGTNSMAQTPSGVGLCDVHDAAGFACVSSMHMCAVLCDAAGLVTTSGRLTT
jgi:hypothetical protein